MFLKDEPAMVIKKDKTRFLIVADLHIGITKDLYESGFVLPRQGKVLADKINRLKKETKTNGLIVLGDIKHKVNGITLQETKEIPEFLRELEYRKIIILKGNHDGWIERIIKNSEIEKDIIIRKYISIGDYFLTHGHRNIRTGKKIIVIGHNHPFVRFTDELGAIYYEPVWLKGQTKRPKKELIIMPAFNELSGMMIVNEQPLLGPVAKLLNKKETHVFLLDGTDLGPVTDLKSNVDF